MVVTVEDPSLDYTGAVVVVNGIDLVTYNDVAGSSSLLGSLGLATDWSQWTAGPGEIWVRRNGVESNRMPITVNAVPAGMPTMASVTPSTSPLSTSTALAITGANFQNPAWFGPNIEAVVAGQSSADQLTGGPFTVTSDTTATRNIYYSGGTNVTHLVMNAINTGGTGLVYYTSRVPFTFTGTTARKSKRGVGDDHTRPA